MPQPTSVSTKRIAAPQSVQQSAPSQAPGRLMTAALEAMRDVEKNGKKGTPPPMVARNSYYVAAAIADVYARHQGPKADAIAASVTAQLTNALVGQQVMPVSRAEGADIVNKWAAAAAKDGADKAGAPRPPSTPDQHLWTPANEEGQPISPLLPSMGKVKPSVAANATVRAKEPRFNDADWRAFFKGYANRSAEDKKSARYWADGPGTLTPPGHWNTIAARVSQVAGLSAAESAALFRNVNSALFDAGIATWDSKYAHGAERPYQAAKRLGIPFTPELKTPPFPGYPSGHATFSAAAAAVLGGTFDKKAAANPELMKKLRTACLGSAQTKACVTAINAAKSPTAMFAALAKEAALSRVAGGIHISHDGTFALQVGRQIGLNVLRAGRES